MSLTPAAPGEATSPNAAPRGWLILGTIERQSDHSVGAFGRSPGGRYAQIMGDHVRLLDPREAEDALRHIKPGTRPAEGRSVEVLTS